MRRASSTIQQQKRKATRSSTKERTSVAVHGREDGPGAASGNDGAIVQGQLTDYYSSTSLDLAIIRFIIARHPRLIGIHLFLFSRVLTVIRVVFVLLARKRVFGTIATVETEVR